jgi:hypothetical protein
VRSSPGPRKPHISHSARIRRHARPVPWLLALAVLLGISATGCGGARAVAPAKHLETIEALASGEHTVALGVNTANAPSLGPLRAFSTLAGREPAVAMWYQTWSEPLFYINQVRSLAKQDYIPMINWHPTGSPSSRYTLRAIASGEFDAYIRASARSAARWRRPVFLDLAQEMNIPGYAWSPGVHGNTPALYIRAWRHVVSIFRAEGARNVRWVWAPNTDCDGRCPFSAFYPGDEWVDWVGLDGYNLAGVHGGPWKQFQRIFGGSYRVLTSLTDKPVMIAETASGENGGSKAQWIVNMRDALLGAFPRVRLLVWFDRVKEADWLINSSPSSLAAFRTIMRLPPFVG